MVQLEPRQTIVCIGHNSNTFDKSRLRTGASAKTFKKYDENVSSSAQLTDIIRKYAPLLEENMRQRLFLVCGPWGSGTTAVVRVLKECGAQVPSPFFQTNDLKTRDSHEMQLFRSTVLDHVNESTLKRTTSSQDALKSLANFSCIIAASKELDSGQAIVLKLPVAALLLPEICRIFDTKLIVCMRPLNNIENSRLRRQWPSQYGKAGAELIYSVLFSYIIDANVDVSLVRYGDMVANPSKCIARLVEYCGLDPTASQLEKAYSTIADHR